MQTDLDYFYDIQCARIGMGSVSHLSAISAYWHGFCFASIRYHSTRRWLSTSVNKILAMALILGKVLTNTSAN